jgi:hypothetical protein
MLTLSREQISQFVVYAGPNRWGNGGFQILVKFPNGWGASIACTPWTIGLELAAIKKGETAWYLTSAHAVNLTVEDVQRILTSMKGWEAW